MPTCTHLSALNPQPPRYNQAVSREECTQCFDGQDLPEGIDVCLSCFNGGCPRLHAHAHADKHPGHELVLNIRRTRKPKHATGSPSVAAKRNSGEPPHKKLAIREEAPEEDKYDFHTQLKCYGCGGQQIAGDDKTDNVIAAILSTTSSTRQSDVKAWEAAITTCDHTETLVQEASKKLEQSGLAHCASCELTNNLWLCLSCGALGCGRQQFGGVSGNGHALSHFDSTRHPLAVKLGTIEPDGTADIYCYACNEERVDPYLATHLGNFGINVAQQSKTQKSLTELEIEQNQNFEFAMTGEDGKDLEPLFGPGLTGLRNLGNSCYMASVLQTLFSLPTFADRYYTKGSAHSLLCQNPSPAQCFECQMAKIADGLLSGRYSVPRPTDSASNDDATAESFAPAGSGQPESTADPVQTSSTAPPKAFQEGLKPSMFKALVGKDHEEFKTMRQQDSEEFLKHLIKMIQRESSKSGSAAATTMLDDNDKSDPTEVFQFEMEERLQCTECKGVRYKTVGEETLSIPVPFIEKPKTAAPADSTHDAMELDSTVSKGKAPVEGENAEPGPTSSSSTGGTAPSPSAAKEQKTEWESVRLEECLNLLTHASTIEYKCPKCEKNVEANKSTKFSSFPEVLVVHAQRFRLHNWVPEKVDVPIILPATALALDTYLGSGKQEGEEELPQDASAGAAQAVEYNEAAMAQLEGMGFPTVRCQKALLATGNSDAEAAMNWLFQHMEDPDIDDPIPAAATTGGNEPTADQIAMVTEMGFTPAQARKALRETGGSTERAVDWLFSHPDDMGDDATTSADQPSTGTSVAAAKGSKELPAQYRLKAFISHKGPSVHSGHYVAHIKEPGVGWVLFNDEKVVKAEGGAQSADALMPFAYLYIFEKIKNGPN